MKKDDLLVKLEYLTLAGIVAAQVLGRDGLVSLLFSLTFVLTAVLWLRKAVRGVSVLEVLILLASFVCVAVNGVLTGTDVTPSYFKKLIMFWVTVLLFGVLGEHRPDGEEVFFRTNAALAVFLAGMYGLDREGMHLFNGQVSGYLTFRFENPNLTGVFLACVCMMEMIRAVRSQKGPGKAGHFLLALLMLKFTVETRSRNSMLMLAVFAAGSVLLWLFPKLRMTKPLAAVTALLPLLFAVCYLLAVRWDWVHKWFAFLAGEGKNIDSRVNLWEFALGHFASSPLVGAYSQISFGTGLSQLHNTHLDVLASYGVLVFGLLWGFLGRILYRARGGGLCLLAFVCVLLSGVGEGMLFSGGLGIYIYGGIFLMLAGGSDEDRLFE